MSRIKHEVNLQEYVCEELDRIRKMTETYDFSSLRATVERIKRHAEVMESALTVYSDSRYALLRILDKDVSDAEKLEQIKLELKSEKRYPQE